MTHNPVRIGKIRMKAGGAEVRVLDRSADAANGENWRGMLVRHARDIASYEREDSRLVGFVVIGLFSDGGHSLGFRYDPESSLIPRRLLPAYIEELIRADMVTRPLSNDEAVEVFNNQRV